MPTQETEQKRPDPVIGPKAHVVKSTPEFFALAASGMKDWELRLNDRDYRVGDTLEMREWDKPNGYLQTEGGYTGTVIQARRIKLVLAPPFGLEPGYVILGLCGPIVIRHK